MADVYVTLDTTGSPPKFDFQPHDVPIGPGTETINWIARGSNFAFAALAFDHKNPFCNVIVQAATISADDDNHQKEIHAYAVLVSVKGTYYSSKSGGPHAKNDPTIRNNS